ncbi:MAG TPA: heavy metal-binding domain-containing protein [Solirubrobacteraceae bacterium]|nr:heavy metal-binding domain-containing protein [Solirubrobacteraceae bacterium]
MAKTPEQLTPEPAESQAEEAEQRESLARIEAGHIPVSAERRLRELADAPRQPSPAPGGPRASADERGAAPGATDVTPGAAARPAVVFTSDLSIAGFALCKRLGLTPVSQVMGSSIYQMGYQGAWGQRGGWGQAGFAGGFMFELDTLSEALNEVRSRALRRLAEEAQCVGADAVVEVETRAGEADLEAGSVSLEHNVLGTAVRRAHRMPGSGRSSGIGQRAGRSSRNVPRAERSSPVLTELSVAEFAKLVEAGFEPLGIVAWSSVFFAGYSFGPGIGGAEAFGLGTTQNFELREFTQAFYNARETVMAQLSAQAAALGAAGIVGMRIGHTARRQDLAGSFGVGSRDGLMITFNAIGTAIAERTGVPAGSPKPILDLSA